ncbi:MAG TPA: ABC transporter ATP-binding protein [Candidatus Limnocylindrales bacterium]
MALSRGRGRGYVRRRTDRSVGRRPTEAAVDGPVILTKGLTKSHGRQRGIADLDLEVGAGEVFGYLGPNGAGKTTTIRLLLDTIRPTSGSATVLGRRSHADSVEIRRRVGYLPGDLRLYDSLSGRELVTYLGSLRGAVPWSRASALAERLDCDLSREIRALSSGNRQKLGLIQTFMSDPELLILDEPTNGLDPLVQQTFYGLVREARADGRTVFLSSHVLPEVERVCDRVGILREGRLVAVERIADLRGRGVRSLEVAFTGLVDAGLVAGVEGVRDVAAEGHLHKTRRIPWSRSMSFQVSSDGS